MIQITQFGAILGMELPEIIIVTIIVALIIGGHKLPQLVRKLFRTSKKVTPAKGEDAPDSTDEASAQ